MEPVDRDSDDRPAESLERYHQLIRKRCLARGIHPIYRDPHGMSASHSRDCARQLTKYLDTWQQGFVPAGLYFAGNKSNLPDDSS